MGRPFISFLTDFGPDAAAAICRGVMFSIAPDAQVVDISHSVRKYAIHDGAFLLWASLPWMPVGVHVGVVDPGVGTARRPIAVQSARGDHLVGPDNGLLIPAAERLGGVVEARRLENREWMLDRPSSTFHGRDIFSPMAAHLALGEPFELVGSVVDAGSLVELRFPRPEIGEGVLRTSVIYVDSFGNLRLAGAADDLGSALPGIAPGDPVEVTFDAAVSTDDSSPAHAAHSERVPWSRTFGEVALGAPLLYEDSFGSLAYADNQGSVAQRLDAGVGRHVRIARA